ncbi:hypothetical protein [Micromonospora sp. WMMD1155]|uniref:hypothetical protein n=1 Tax=Micromonospora sp. WMMD1155 TaxID=3016094 RepID=UPI00249A2BFB|nr:hypothetical protein [Micromonospora sp. WMMD1155]WFE49479.1 hypothetical protein O7617_03675 [Micromonospora sp. WMMD1155]
MMWWSPDACGSPRNDPALQNLPNLSRSPIWIQAGGAIIAAVFAGGALLIAVDTLEDQQRINQSQLDLNTATQDRQHKRYASRVAWWAKTHAPTADDHRVMVQNRSTVPLRGLEFFLPQQHDWVLGDTGAPLLLFISDIPPCTVVRYSIPPYMSNEAAGAILASFSDPVWELRFTDNLDRWVLSEQGLRPAKTVPYPTTRGGVPNIPYTELREDLAGRSEAQDCGEGG